MARDLSQPARQRRQAISEMSAVVDSSMLGNPQSFRWTTRTETWFTELGSTGYVIIDVAPDEGSFEIWPM